MKKFITITQCDCFNPAFEDVTPGSIHEILTAPSPYKDDDKGVWIQGKGERVKVLNNEYLTNFKIEKIEKLR